MERNLIVNGKTYGFTKHAYERLVERNIPLILCKKILQMGIKEIKTGHSGKKQTVYWASNYKVAVDHSNNTIVTVMKCKKSSYYGYRRKKTMYQVPIL